MHHRSLPTLSLALLACLALDASASDVPEASALDGLRGMFPSALGARRTPRGPLTAQAHSLSGQGFSLRTGRLGVDVALQGARPGPLGRDRDLMIARGAGPSASDVVLRVTPRGVEDFLALAAPLPSPEVAYEVRLDGVAGLRLVANTLEFLSDDGAPGLRVAPPYLIDADRQRHPASLSVEGCQVDTSGAAPWGRPVTPPGSSSCVVRVSWSEQGMRYPALLDPDWGNPATLDVPRVSPALFALSDGRILIAGGLAGSAPNLAPTASSVYFDPATKAFAAALDLPEPRWGHSLSAVPGGVLLVGGVSAVGGPASAKAHRFSAQKNQWEEANPPGVARAFHTATGLGSGRVLLVGGHGGDPAVTSPIVEVYDPFNDKWNGAPGLPAGQGRYAHTATLLQDGRVLVVAGARGNGPLSDALLFSPQTPGAPWAALAGTVDFRSGHQAILARSGQVLVAGGCNGAPSFDKCTEQESVWVFTPSPLGGTLQNMAAGPLESAGFDQESPRGGRLFLGLPSGWMHASGGRFFNESKAEYSNTFDVSWLRPGDAGPLSVGAVSGDILGWQWGAPVLEDNLTPDRAFHAGIVAASGKAVVVGGLDGALNPLDHVSVLSFSCDKDDVVCQPFLANGEPCGQSPVQCASGVCVKETGSKGEVSVCCDRPCAGSICSSCLGEKTNLSDGTCGVVTAKDGQHCKPSALIKCDTSDPAEIKTDRGLCAGGECVDAVEKCGAFDCAEGTGCFSSCDPEKGTKCYATDTKNWCFKQGDAAVCETKRGLGDGCESPKGCFSGFCEESLEKPSARSCCLGSCAAPRCDTPRKGIIRSRCGKNGVCVEDYEFCAGGFACSDKVGSSIECKSQCTSSDDCNAESFCAGGKCLTRKDAGGACAGDDQCKSGSCRDGVCCSDKCSGACRSCNSKLTDQPDGQCHPVLENREQVGSCEKTDNPCGNTGKCGANGVCQLVEAGSLCGPPTGVCKGPALSTKVCDGKGACNSGDFLCSPFLCRVNTCSTVCDGDADCADGAACVGGKCFKLEAVGCDENKDERVQACNDGACVTRSRPCQNGGLCVNGACKSGCAVDLDCNSNFFCEKSNTCKPKAFCEGQVVKSPQSGREDDCLEGHRCLPDAPTSCLSRACKSSSECLEGYVCGSNGACRAPLKVSTAVDVDCYCAQPGRPAGGGGAALAALAGLALGLRARRARCGR